MQYPSIIDTIHLHHCMYSTYDLMMIFGCVADKLIVGSFQGLIRIYEPHPPAFSADHVILERQMSSPVLQVAAGRFVQ